MLPVPASASRGNIEVCQALFSPLSAAIKETLLCWRAENYTLMLALGPAVPCPGLCPRHTEAGFIQELVQIPLCPTCSGGWEELKLFPSFLQGD